MILRRTILASIAASIAAFYSKASGFFGDESTAPLMPPGEGEVHIHLTWPGTRVHVTGTGFLCITDRNGTQWSEFHGDPNHLKIAFADGIREGVSKDEFPPMRAESLVREAIFSKDEALIETVISNGWITRGELEKQWMAFRMGKKIPNKYVYPKPGEVASRLRRNN